MVLIFKLDRLREGKHLVQVFRRLDSQDAIVKNPRALWRYGYCEDVKDTNGRSIIQIVAELDREYLLEVRRLSPTQLEDGSLVFDFAPDFLDYSRVRDNVIETDDSLELWVDCWPLKQAAHISYDPQEGLIIKTGYEVEGYREIVPATQLRITKDGRYARVGNTFKPLPVITDQAIQKWLDRPQRTLTRQQIPEFFERDFVLLQSQFSAVLTDLAKQIKVIPKPLRPRVRVDRHESGWLDLTLGYEAGGRLLHYNMMMQGVEEQYTAVDEFTWIKNDLRLVDNAQKELERLADADTDGNYRVPATEFVSLEEFIKSIGGVVELSAAYQAFLDQLTSFKGDENYRLSRLAESELADAGVTLRPYQRAGIHWLTWLHDNQLHGLLADDMGLGKTLQAISVARRAYEKTWTRQHSLVLAPVSVLFHWQREIARFWRGIRIVRYHGTERQRVRNLFHALEPIVFLSTFETITNDITELKKIPFYYLIIDEATRIKNPSAKRTKAIKAVNAAHRLALSGTPVENHPAELWSIFDFLMRGHLGKYGTFERLYEERISAGDKRAAEDLGRRIRPFLLRRMKEEVAKDLPEKIEMDEWCQLTKEQRHLYLGLQDRTDPVREALLLGQHIDYPQTIRPLLTRLKQICDHPGIVTDNPEPLTGRSEKYDWIISKVQEICSHGEQVVLFSHFLKMLNLIEKGLPPGLRYIRIDGSTSSDDRQQQIDLFNDGRAQVALCSLRAVGHGVNLTAANHVIHCDRWWNPAVEEQATDRVHRIGQDKTVYVYRIMVEGTLEERIETLLDRKRNMADSIMTAATNGERQWTREALIELLRPLD